MTINILVTGGTFDKEYNELNGELFFKDTHLSDMLKVARNKVDVDIRTVMLIDSLNMVDSDRKLIAQNCKDTKSDKIIVTHGTDTMIETAKVVASVVQDKTIIFTGAMIPYTFGHSSDGIFNLGCAMAAVQSLPHGVYITMNGKIFPYNKVKKNTKTGIFENLE